MREPLARREHGAGAPILLVHGDFSDGAGAWSAVVEALVARRRLVVVDRRGHGASPREPRPFTIASDAADLIGVLDRAGIDAAHVAGHSYGALVAAELAATAPERVISLHLAEPPWLALAPDNDDARRLDEAVRRIRDAAAIVGPERTAAAFFGRFTTAEGVAALRASPRWPAIVREAGRIADGEYGGGFPAARLDRIDLALPMTVYRGGRSHPALQAVAAEIVRRRPSARLVTVPEAGHAVQHFDAFAAALLDGTK